MWMDGSGDAESTPDVLSDSGLPLFDAPADGRDTCMRALGSRFVITAHMLQPVYAPPGRIYVNGCPKGIHCDGTRARMHPVLAHPSAIQIGRANGIPGQASRDAALVPRSAPRIWPASTSP